MGHTVLKNCAKLGQYDRMQKKKCFFILIKELSMANESG